MRAWSADRLARAADARVLVDPARVQRRAGPGAPPPEGPDGAGIDSRTIGSGRLFVGLRGGHEDGGRHAPAALAAGAWGVLVSPAHSAAAVEAAAATGGAVLVAEDTLAALHRLAREWRRKLGRAGARVIGITGSTGKTSTKDILAAVLAPYLRTVATPANLNTEIGVPLALLGAPAGTEALVVEMAMRGPGQIAELSSIAEPDIGVIVNVGPAHLELLGSIEAIAAAKAELIAALPPGAVAVLPAGESLLDPHLRTDLRTITFGVDGDVELVSVEDDGGVTIAAEGELLVLRPSFRQAHNLTNLLAAVAAARGLGISPAGVLDVRFSAGRGQLIELPSGVRVIDDCYNANPMSMQAAIDELARTASGRRIAVLGGMLELGERDSARLHREIGEHAASRGVDVLVAVGPLGGEIAAGFSGRALTAAGAVDAAEMLERLVRAGDTILVKASRGVRLESVVESLLGAGAGAPAAAVPAAPRGTLGRS